MKGSDQADKSSTESTDTRLFSTDKGEIEIPVLPQRVISDCGLPGDVLALGVTPVAIENYGVTDVAYKELIKEVKVLEKWEPEYLMAEKPDMNALAVFFVVKRPSCVVLWKCSERYTNKEGF